MTDGSKDGWARISALGWRSKNRRDRKKNHRVSPRVERLEQLALLVPIGPLTFTVNSTDPTNLGTLSGNGEIIGYYPGEVNLLTAILAVNLHAQDNIAAGSAPAHDTINFDIVPGETFGPSPGTIGSYTNPASGPFLITPGSQGSVPIAASVTIDATTQSGFAPDKPQVYLSGTLVNQDGESGLELDGGSSSVTGLGFINFDNLPTFISALTLGGNGGDSVTDNVFGISPTGKAAGNATDISIRTAGNTIGGIASGAGNIISNNGVGFGVLLDGGASSGPSGVTGNLIEGNLIGTDASGENAFGNSAGVAIENADDNTIGGTTGAARNVISGNIDGIDLNGAKETDSAGDPLGSFGNLIEGNWIGTDATGTARLANTHYGISITADENNNNTIGGTLAAEGNLIAFNSLDGVTIYSSTFGPLDQSTGDAILGNQIFGNGGIGIDLGNNGAIPNDSRGHVGPNNYQNFPVVQDPNASGIIQGSLASAAGTYRVEYFADTPTGSSGHVGQVFLGAQSVTIGVSGAINLSFNPTVNVPTGSTIVATATDASGDTSEFTFAAPPALIVNETADQDITSLSPGELSLRAAIETVNQETDTPDQTIDFNIPDSNVPVITLSSPLPAVAVPVIIDASTQPGTGMVAINGAQAGSSDGLDLAGGYSTVEGLIIQHFTGNGIVIEDLGGDTVIGNFIGTGTDGSGDATDMNTGDGVLIKGTSDNTIGGNGVQIITGNRAAGVEIQSAGATGNVVQGNSIGLDATGAAVGNGGGVFIDNNASNNTIGGNTESARNIISGNSNAGIDLYQDASANVVEGNYIGVSASANSTMPNAVGVLIEASSTKNTIGGNTPAAANVISGNTGAGVELTGSAVADNQVQGNLIGTDPSGTTTLPNQTGVLIQQGAFGNLIGGLSSSSSGTLTGDGNIISGNTGSGVLIEGTATSNNSVLGNDVGTDIHGAMAIANGSAGVQIAQGATLNTIGGAVAGSGNLISGNNNAGVLITDPMTGDNVVQGNSIGTNAAGTAAIANSGQGVQLTSGTYGNSIGGASGNSGGKLTGAGNLISGNADSGIGIFPGNTQGTNGNAIAGNDIGTDITGASALANHDGGIRIVESSANTIGGENPGTGNLISGNAAGASDQGDGITIEGPPSSPTIANPGANSNVVIGNIIGLASGREAQLANAGNGVTIEQTATGNLIGVDPPGNVAGNVISGNDGDGVLISGSNNGSNAIEGNFIGSDGSGTKPLGNAAGVVISGGSAKNTVGGTAGAARNLISGNQQAGVEITDPFTNQNQVLNNLIGTQTNGTVRLDNSGPGVLIQSEAADNSIGAPGAGNVISGNTGDGVSLLGVGTTGNNIFANKIGADINGNAGANLGNLGNGVFIQDASANHIGGSLGTGVQPSDGNIISDNFDAGVVVSGAFTDGDSILSNVLSGNGTLGIDLEDGANNAMTPPLFTVVIGINGGGGLTDAAQVVGTEGTYLVQFFSSPTRTVDTLRAQAAHFVASATVQLTSNGFVNTPLPSPAPGDKYIVMTVTDNEGDTSQFSFASVNGAHVDQGMHLSSRDAEELKSNKSVITVGGTLSLTDIITINQQLSSVAQVRIDGKGKHAKPPGPPEPTGTIFFEVGNKVLARVKVKVLKGVAQAKARVKLKAAGTQTIFAVYEPDGAAQQNGFTPTFTSSTVTVNPAARKHGGKPKAIEFADARVNFDMSRARGRR